MSNVTPDNGDVRRAIRVLYSFPHGLGTGRIADTAWYQVKGLAEAGADVTVYSTSSHRALPKSVHIRPTLSCGKVRIPFRVIGSMRAFALHDSIVSHRIAKFGGDFDIIHTWPLGARETLKTAARLGIPTVLERPNAHTRFAYEVVQRECDRLGVALPPHHEHAYNSDVLRKEEMEYALSDFVLCPSEFVVRTFLDQGFERSKLIRHFYGYDENVFYPTESQSDGLRPLRMLFVGVCAVRKGVHYALEAWLRSPAHRGGTFSIAGEFLPAYAEKLAPMLTHPSVRVLGHRNDIPEIIRNSDVLILPSIEEGFGLVVTEAMGSGCVPLASEACTDICRHMETGLVHRVGDVDQITQQITTLHEDRSLLARLRANGLASANQVTWGAAGVKLLEVYRRLIAANASRKTAVARSEMPAG